MFKKNILVLLSLPALLCAQSFDTFLENALQSSPYLRANALSVQRTKAESQKLQRYKNPTLSLEGVYYAPDSAKDESGYRMALTQPLRLWGVGDAIESLGKARLLASESLARLSYAEFQQRLSLLYIEYITLSSLEKLAKEELNISQSIKQISHERYMGGTIAKVKYLQTKVELKRVQNLLNQRRVKRVQAYYRLLAFAGIKEEPELDTNYSFKMLETKESRLENAKISYLKAQKRSFDSLAKLKENKISWIDISAEYEREIDQDVMRLGVDIPLTLFNKNKEEQQVARLQAKESELSVENEELKLSLTLKRLGKELELLEELILSTKELYSSQKELLEMYEDAYKIASVNLLELQNIKNQLIETKTKAILLQKQKNQNIVTYNYALGAYNENR